MSSYRTFQIYELAFLAKTAP